MSAKSFIPIPPPAPIPEAGRVSAAELLEKYLEGSIDLICVMGPTASGKTRYAVNLAREINRLLKSGKDAAGAEDKGTESKEAERCVKQACGAEGKGAEDKGIQGHGAAGAEIISADSRQIYIGMDIGTGKDLCEYGEIPVHLVDIVPAGERYNICRYQRDFSRVYRDCRERGAIPILCGGSGLYIEAVTKPEYKLDDNNAVELVLPRKTFYLATTVHRETRRARIDKRLDERFAEGMVEEVRGLINRGVDPEVLIRYGLEYKFITLHVLGQLDFPTMHRLLQTAIHQFAKRQMTWFRGMERRGFNIHWISADNDMETKVNQVLQLLKTEQEEDHA